LTWGFLLIVRFDAGEFLMELLLGMPIREGVVPRKGITAAATHWRLLQQIYYLYVGLYR